jgi:hypothetical protein
MPPGCHCCRACTKDVDNCDSSRGGVCYVQAKATAAERRAADTESEMLLLGRSLRDAEAAVVEWQVGNKQAPCNGSALQSAAVAGFVCSENYAPRPMLVAATAQHTTSLCTSNSIVCFVDVAADACPASR